MQRILRCAPLCALALVLLHSVACSEPARITDIQQFESVVLNSADIFLVLFTFKSSDPIRGRGVNQDQCRKVEAGMPAVIEKLVPLGITVMVADVEDVSAIASEFNVGSDFDLSDEAAGAHPGGNPGANLKSPPTDATSAR